MTLADIGLARTLQGAGLATAAVGVLATLVFGAQYVGVWVPLGLAAMALDGFAIRTASEVRAMLAAMAKFAVAIAGLGAAAGTAASAAAGLLPADTGPVVIMLSVFPSAVGAMRRGQEE